MNRWTKDVTDRSFEADVLERSRAVPVVVDFWAPWCAPCRTIGPVLERLAAESAGGFELAKVNVDENPGVADAFGIRSIPAVKAFRDGALVDEFVGALPEAQIRQFLAGLLPTEADLLAERGEAQEAAGAPAEAEALYRRALELDPNHPRARLGAGRLLVESDPERALAELDRVLPGTPERAEADRLAARLRLSKQDGAGEAELRARIERDPADLAARLELGRLLAASERYEDALRELLEIVRRDRDWQDAAGRRAMLDVFDVLGARHPVTERFRGELARVLFS